MAEIKQYGSYERKANDGVSTNPSAEEVDKFHTNADTDLRGESTHHTLGPAPSQASPGNHRHDGGDSELLLVGETISGSRNSDAWRLSINAILVKMGAKDNSTA
jgi:hypothetical protein